MLGQRKILLLILNIYLVNVGCQRYEVKNKEDCTLAVPDIKLLSRRQVILLPTSIRTQIRNGDYIRIGHLSAFENFKWKGCINSLQAERKNSKWCYNSCHLANFHFFAIDENACHCSHLKPNRSSCKAIDRPLFSYSYELDDTLKGEDGMDEFNLQLSATNILSKLLPKPNSADDENKFPWYIKRKNNDIFILSDKNNGTKAIVKSLCDEVGKSTPSKVTLARVASTIRTTSPSTANTATSISMVTSIKASEEQGNQQNGKSTHTKVTLARVASTIRTTSPSTTHATTSISMVTSIKANEEQGNQQNVTVYVIIPVVVVGIIAAVLFVIWRRRNEAEKHNQNTGPSTHNNETVDRLYEGEVADDHVYYVLEPTSAVATTKPSTGTSGSVDEDAYDTIAMYAANKSKNPQNDCNIYNTFVVEEMNGEKDHSSGGVYDHVTHNPKGFRNIDETYDLPEKTDDSEDTYNTLHCAQNENNKVLYHSENVYGHTNRPK